jgi:hypothetical protein
MRSTLQNSGQTTITIISLASTLPSNAVTQAGAPQLASYMQNIPVTGALFAAFQCRYSSRCTSIGFIYAEYTSNWGSIRSLFRL